MTVLIPRSGSGGFHSGGSTHGERLAGTAATSGLAEARHKKHPSRALSKAPTSTVLAAGSSSDPAVFAGELMDWVTFLHFTPLIR